MKIAVTGATGKLGRLVVEKLKERTAEANIVALARTPQKGQDLGVEVRAFDYGNLAQMTESLAGIDTLLLISGSELGQRLAQHANVINAAKNAGVKAMAYTSLLHVDTSSSPLVPEHLGTEKALAESGIPYTLLRNGWYTENYTDTLKDVIAKGAVYGSAGEGEISSASREDYAEAAAIVLTTEGHEGKTYELAGDKSFTMTDYALELSKQAGKAIPYVNLPEAEYAKALQEAGVPAPIAEFLASSDVSTEKGDLFDEGHQLSLLLGRLTTPLSSSIAASIG
ncbi:MULTISPECIES: SDR family oxidoreductase [Zobellia]|uniref:SDR family oxidoreductase n=1 Tax=Zobellia TaxID=112040 RepID=UPI000B52EDFB|nr:MULTISPECIES: SDR family oxidoreductase [Zobellia]MBU3025817.1 SDR family oxidoreductase [Zobellia galactanivorans]OWW25927.1 NAD(P)-dependent oxidoreductase [Zobellia sp. OII3]